MNCGEAKQLLVDLALDEVTTEQRRAIERHAETCEACREQLAGWRQTRTLLARGLPGEEIPRRITFVEAGVGRRFAWLSRPAFTVPMSMAAAVVLMVAALAMVQARLVGTGGRLEMSFGAGQASPIAAPAQGQAVPQASSVQPASFFTREQVGEMVTRAVRESEQRQRAELAALVESSAKRQEQRHYTALSALADQMVEMRRTQNIFYKQQEGTRSALEQVAARLPMDQGVRQ